MIEREIADFFKVLRIEFHVRLRSRIRSRTLVRSSVRVFRTPGAFECLFSVESTQRHPARSRRVKTRLGKFICVAVVRFELDPIVFYRLVYASLKIAVPHLEEVIASKFSARRN